ncbi:hypothetical protein D9619_004357 [Psilocybe cf. subviscida]|uniref:Uncharacterized protein n=1 Tax=Psilocybe cf. subviscida TaxID=2480587 RepID=A0A8H5F802_9AGAR|nr:hypothetical protein D9619_004357 [Psilocybe cf. subviscida]
MLPSAVPIFSSREGRSLRTTLSVYSREVQFLTLGFRSAPIRHPASPTRPSFFRSPPPLLRRGGASVLPMAATTSSVHPPLGEDNNLALGGGKAKLTRKDTTRTVLPNLGYPLQPTGYPRCGAAQPAPSSFVDASPASRSREVQHTGGARSGCRTQLPPGLHGCGPGISARTSNHVDPEASAGGSRGDWEGWSIHGALKRMGVNISSHVSLATKTLKMRHSRFNRHSGGFFGSSS